MPPPDFNDIWNNVVVQLTGKKLAVLGARGVGKTRLITFLSTGSLAAIDEQTHTPTSRPLVRRQLRDLDLKVKEGWDLPGGPDAYPNWKTEYDEADVVLYLLCVEYLRDGNRHGAAQDRMRRDLRQIQQWRKAREERWMGNRPRFALVGTFCDQDPRFEELRPGDYGDEIRQLPIMTELVLRGGGTKEANLVLGSLRTLPETEALVQELFGRLLS